MNYEQIKKLLKLERKKPKEDRYRMKDLLVMSKGSDPFYAGQPGRRKKAEWFAKIWNEYGAEGYHLRRLHYKILGLAVKPDGKPYQNTKDDWDLLNAGSTNARHLGLVRYDDFVDRRNPDPKVIVEYNNDSLCHTYKQPVETEISGLDGNTWAEYNLEQLRKYRLEVWAEKSTMDDILIPLCERYKIFFISGAGFESLTHINVLLWRIQQYIKPCRIFYISDYDNAGQNMPRQVGRQLQFRLYREHLEELDIKLKPIILLKNQVEKYQLPCAPGKKETELDALEALHPGEFEKIVKSYLDKYIDLEKAREFKSQQNDKISKSNDMINEIVESEFQDEIDDLENKVMELGEKISERIENIGVEKVGKPDSKEIVEENDWLFRSELDYFEQLVRFKQFEAEQMP